MDDGNGLDKMTIKQKHDEIAEMKRMLLNEDFSKMEVDITINDIPVKKKA